MTLVSAPRLPAFSSLFSLRSVAETRRRLRIAYLGGSLTEGYGASDPAKLSWRAQTTRFFRETFPAAEIHEIHAAIGGTGSYLGAFRLERDVVAAQPDLVFVEFAVNDNRVPEHRVLRSVEGIIRHLRTATPPCEIVLLLNATEDYFADYTATRTPVAVALHERIAAHYGLPVIQAGHALWQEVAEGRATPADLFIDGVHPTDLGYQIYTTSVLGFLRKALAASPIPPAPAVSALPEPLTLNPLERARLVDSWSVNGPGWRRSPESFAGRYPHYLESIAPGASFIHEFHGTDIGLYWLVAPDSGEVEIILDDQAPQIFASWDHYALTFTRANYVTLGEDLPLGPHALRLRVLPTQPGQSAGTTVRIGALLVQ